MEAPEFPTSRVTKWVLQGHTRPEDASPTPIPQLRLASSIRKR